VPYVVTRTNHNGGRSFLGPGGGFELEIEDALLIPEQRGATSRCARLVKADPLCRQGSISYMEVDWAEAASWRHIPKGLLESVMAGRDLRRPPASRRSYAVLQGRDWSALWERWFMERLVRPDSGLGWRRSKSKDVKSLRASCAGQTVATIREDGPGRAAENGVTIKMPGLEWHVEEIIHGRAVRVRRDTLRVQSFQKAKRLVEDLFERAVERRGAGQVRDEAAE